MFLDVEVIVFASGSPLSKKMEDNFLGLGLEVPSDGKGEDGKGEDDKGDDGKGDESTSSSILIPGTVEAANLCLLGPALFNYYK